MKTYHPKIHCSPGTLSQQHATLRWTKGHVVRHAVPPCALEPILGGHHRHQLFRRKYKKKQKERGANKKKKLIANRPRRRQATKIACDPDQGEKTQQNTFTNTMNTFTNTMRASKRPRWSLPLLSFRSILATSSFGWWLAMS